MKIRTSQRVAKEEVGNEKITLREVEEILSKSRHGIHIPELMRLFYKEVKNKKKK